MKSKKLVIRISLLLVILSTINFMYLSPDKLQWVDSIYQRFPVVKYKVNPTMIGFNTGDRDAVVDIIRSAGSLWSFQSGESNFQLSYNGTTNSKPLGYDEIGGCTEENKKALRELDNIVYASNTEDSDCSGQACTYIWSCEGNGDNTPGEIFHFDMEINARDYEWDTGTNHTKSYNLFTVVAKQFGQLLGLSHCSPGDSETACQAQVTLQGTSNPTSDSLLYKFIEPELIRTALSPDDKAGLQSLYGSLDSEDKTILADSKKLKEKVNSLCNPCQNPLVETGIYKPSEREQSAWNEYITDRTTSGLETKEGKYKIFAHYQKSYFDTYRIGKVSAEDYMLDAINRRNEFLADLPTEFIPNSKNSLYVDILNLERGIKEYKNELDPMYYSFLEAEYKSLIIIRKAMIEEEMKR